MRYGVGSALAVLAFLSTLAAADDLGPVKEQAVRLYDRGSTAKRSSS